MKDKEEIIGNYIIKLLDDGRFVCIITTHTCFTTGTMDFYGYGESKDEAIREANKNISEFDIFAI